MDQLEFLQCVDQNCEFSFLTKLAIVMETAVLILNVRGLLISQQQLLKLLLLRVLVKINKTVVFYRERTSPFSE